MQGRMARSMCPTDCWAQHGSSSAGCWQLGRAPADEASPGRSETPLQGRAAGMRCVRAIMHTGTAACALPAASIGQQPRGAHLQSKSGSRVFSSKTTFSSTEPKRMAFQISGSLLFFRLMHLA